MLRFHKIPYHDGKFTWEISPINGSLTKSRHFPNLSRNLPSNIEKALHLINFPYEVQWDSKSKFINLKESEYIKIKKINARFFKLGNNNFLLSILYSLIQKPYFATSQEAFSHISTLKGHEYGSENCFQRCLLAAKLSRSFRKNGVIFIGAELSTFNMHAWIIEGKSQPDLEDRVWINYRPLLAVTFSK